MQFVAGGFVLKTQPLTGHCVRVGCFGHERFVMVVRKVRIDPIGSGFVEGGGS